MSETNNETAVRSRTTSTTSPSKAKLTPLVPGKEDPNRPLVELTHVEKHFGALHVLKDINLTVTKGEVLVVVGPSGSGKSTMCRTINRLEAPATGRQGAREPQGRSWHGIPVVQPVRQQNHS